MRPVFHLPVPGKVLGARAAGEAHLPFDQTLDGRLLDVREPLVVEDKVYDCSFGNLHKLTKSDHIGMSWSEAS